MIEHLSFSQYNSYVQCSRSWYLGRVVGAPPRPGWFTVVGSTVHEAIESLLENTAWQGFNPDVTAIFYRRVREARLIEPDTEQWLAGGPQADPTVKEKALQLALDCYEKAGEFLQDIDVWEVEYDASGRLPGLEVPLKAYVDIIGEHKKHGPTIVDWKTGANKPKDNFQLETYAALLADTKFAKQDLRGSLQVGLWAMLAPKASVARPIDLSNVDPAEVGAKYQAVYEQMKNKIYKTNAGFGCNFCFQQDNCLLTSGPTERAKFYDRAGDDGFPF